MLPNPPSTLQPDSFADLLAAIPQLYESPGTQRDYSQAIRRCAELYGVTDLKSLPLDSPEAFNRRFPRHGFSPDLPFSTESSYEAWRRKVQAPLKKYLGLTARHDRCAPSDDDWSKLLVAATAEAERLEIKPQKLISARILAKEARSHNIRPQDLTPAHIERMAEALTAGRKKSLRRVFPLLEHLRSSSAVIDSYLPSTSLSLPTKAGNAAPPHLLKEAEKWIDDHCRGEYDEIEERYEDGKSEETIKTYLAAFRNYLNIAALAGLITSASTLPEALSRPLFIGAMRSWIKLLPDSGISPRSMLQHIRNIRMIAEKRGLDVKHMAEGIKLNRQLKEGRKAAEEMSAKPKRFCRWLLSEKRHELSFLSLHIAFFKSSKALLEAERYRTLTNAEQIKLRQLGTLAAMAAIWLWIKPLRITNLLGLTISGKIHNLHLPSGKRHHALLLIPAAKTKTKRPIREKVLADKSRALEVIEFYMRHIRLRYPHASASPLLFPGDKSASKPLDDSTVRDWLKSACRAHGFYPMSPHWFRHGAASIFLKYNPGAYVHVGRMLDDTPRTARIFYGFIDDERLSDEAQIEMLRIAGFTDADPEGSFKTSKKT